MILEMRVFVDPALLRVEVPDLVLRPGMLLAARVAERSGQRGILMLAGHPLSAQLPDQVKAGDKLRLQVMEATSERVVMKLVEESAAQQPGSPAHHGTNTMFVRSVYRLSSRLHKARHSLSTPKVACTEPSNGRRQPNRKAFEESLGAKINGKEESRQETATDTQNREENER